jgi:hypothetical protein
MVGARPACSLRAGVACSTGAARGHGARGTQPCACLRRGLAWHVVPAARRALALRRGTRCPLRGPAHAQCPRRGTVRGARGAVCAVSAASWRGSRPARPARHALRTRRAPWPGTTNKPAARPCPARLNPMPCVARPCSADVPARSFATLACL